MQSAIRTLRSRRDRLERLAQIVTRHEAELVAAIDRDFGHRSPHETRLAELYIVAAEARHAIRRLSRWMKPRRVATPWHLLPGVGAHRPPAARRRRRDQSVELPGAAGARARCRGACGRQPRDAEAVGVDAGDIGAARGAGRRALSRRRVRRRRRRCRGRPGVRVAAVRSSVLHGLDGGRAPGRRRRGREPDAGDARARRQIAGAVRHATRISRRRAAARRRQAAQRRTDLHRARLCAGAGIATRRIRRA